MAEEEAGAAACLRRLVASSSLSRRPSVSLSCVSCCCTCVHKKERCGGRVGGALDHACLATPREARAGARSGLAGVPRAIHHLKAKTHAAGAPPSPYSQPPPLSLSPPLFFSAVFLPGQPWLDSAGAPIQAHGGCIVRDPTDGAFYWYGEDKSGGPTHVVGGNGDGSGGGGGGGTARVDVTGIAVYRSPASLTGPWTRLGLALAGGAGAHPDLDAQAGVLERPAVIRRAQASPPGGKAHAPPAPAEWVMWAHVDTADYSAARVGVAVSTAGPAGPFTYKGSFRPGGGGDRGARHEARDLTLFQDGDGLAYLFYSSEGNRVMHIAQLDASYTAISANPAHSVRALVDLGREAPAVFRCGAWVYLMTSGCTGWAPNAAEVFAARSPLGPWVSLGSPAAGGSAAARARTFHSQPAAVVPAWGEGGVPSAASSSSSSSSVWPPPRPDGSCAFIYAGDQWNVDDLGASRYVWLPLWVVPLVEGGPGAAAVLPPPRKAAPGAAKEAKAKAKRARRRKQGAADTTPPDDHPGTAVILQWAPAWGLGDLAGRPAAASALARGGPGRVVEI